MFCSCDSDLCNSINSRAAEVSEEELDIELENSRIDAAIRAELGW